MDLIPESVVPHLGQLCSTFVASVRSVGTAVTLAAVGVYLHRGNYLSSEGKRTLALISQQVTFPLFLFSRILYCNQDWSDAPCPNVMSSLEDVWMLALWPAVCVGIGLLVGAAVIRIAKTPPDQARIVLAAVAFGNSTGLPITLLTVVHANFPITSDLGAMDPTLFLSVYLLLYPVLQWGVGGWLLAPVEEGFKDKEVAGGALKSELCESTVDSSTKSRMSFLADEDDSASEMTPLTSSTQAVASAGATVSNEYWVPLGGPSSPTQQSALSSATRTPSRLLRHNVLHNPDVTTLYVSHRRGLVSNDEGMYMSELDLQGLVRQQLDTDSTDGEDASRTSDVEKSVDGDRDDVDVGATLEGDNTEKAAKTVSTSSKDQTFSAAAGSPRLLRDSSRRSSSMRMPTVHSPLLDRPVSKAQMRRSLRAIPSQYDVESLRVAATNILSRCFQPPVVGALTGMAVAAIPSIRGVLVDLDRRQSRAPLEWMFDALYSVGQAAVPLNMMILGANLNSAYRKGFSTSEWTLERNTMIGILVGKMLVAPLVGILLVWFLKTFCWSIPDDIDASFYLVLMIVFLCPTANNVMVMVELSGSSSLKEGMAQVIALQYMVAPVILSVTMTVAVGVASGWS
jgi:predicted permease